MTKKEGRPPPLLSDRPSDPADLKAQRDAFVHTFFKKGAEFTDDLLRENERLRRQVVQLESENASLRTQLASDEAIRDLLRKIDQLEREKQQLLSSMHAAHEVSSRFSTRYHEVEEELANLANLYVASYQLHSTLRLPDVVKHLNELLEQLVGARRHIFYLATDRGDALVPVTGHGIELHQTKAITVGDTAHLDAAERLIERSFLTGVEHVCSESFETANVDLPLACVPMRIDDKVVGAFAVYSVLEQKARFLAVDFELFKMLGAHAATALAGAFLFDQADRKIPQLRAIPFRENHRRDQGE